MSSHAMPSIDPLEIEHFTKLADTWWDENGPFKALHQLNPLRISFIRDHIHKNFSQATHGLQGITILDVGCGGGLLSEPLARMGATVTAIDATPENVNTAKTHAESMGLSIDYRFEAVEDHTGTYDVVVAMEIIEHVADVPSFIQSCVHRVKPGGLIFFSTINRTWKSYLLGIVAAEHVLKWVPKGTHQWNKFVTPEEIKQALACNKTDILEQTGVLFDPLRNTWIASRRDGVNYMCVGQKQS